jgi:hypothetical protein
MPVDATGQRLLSAFDAHAGDFSRHCRAVAQAGEVVAEADLSALWALAEDVVRASAIWRRAIEGLEIARASRLDLAVAATRVAEAVFDDCLTPLGYGVFRAALDVVLSAP